jgi:hypothetical protein
MIRVTKALARKWVTLLLHTHDTPRRTAAAFAMGVCLAFCPLLGLHTVLALVIAFAFGLNRVAAVAGVYVNLPWLIVPYYTLATMAGARLLGTEAPPQFGDRLARTFDLSFTGGAFWRGLADVVAPFAWPFVIGSTIGAIVLGVIAYAVAVPVIVAGRRHLHLPHRHPRAEAP